MTVEVYSGIRPVHPHRAFWAAVSLLLGVGTLAAGMAWQRSHQVLGDRIQPRDWDISFRPPRRFGTDLPFHEPNAGLYRFIGRTRRGAPALLDVWRLDETHGNNAKSMAEAMLADYALIQSRDPRLLDVEQSAQPIGSLTGVEIRDRQLAAVIRVATVESGVAYGLSLYVRGGPLDDHTYQAFDLTCRSVEVRKE